MGAMLDAAIEWYKAGYSVIRTSIDGEKKPDGKWKTWQSERADVAQLEKWFENDHPGIGVVCGAISGNLEMLELEGRAVAEGYMTKLLATAQQFGIGDLLTRIVNGYWEKSPSGGYHFFYRVHGSAVGNTKLAQRFALEDEWTEQERSTFARTGRRPPRVLIETRGEGGFVVVAPSHGPVHATGQPWFAVNGDPSKVAEVSLSEREALFSVARALNTYRDVLADSLPVQSQPAAPEGELSPGDDFNERGDWQSILQPFGWKIHHTVGSTTHWTRPGKDHGVSASTGGERGDLLYVYTTSTELPDTQGLSKWRTYAILNHAGDFSKTASDLRKQGYGSPLQQGYRGSDQDKSDWRSLTGASNQPGTPIIPPNDDDEQFWNSRPVFNHIRQFARSRLCPPFAVLSHVLLQVVGSIGPEVKLPPIIGGKGSLNLFVAIVGKSGDGKGMARAVAQECIIVHDPADSFTIGSGEGIAATYVKPTKVDELNVLTGENEKMDSVAYIRHRAIFHIAEVATLQEISSRGGSTIIGELNKMYIGESLGFQNRAKETRLPVRAHTYRACLTMDVQPGKASVLLDNEDTGFPQRFMFVEAKDPGLPDGDIDEPASLHWHTPVDLHAQRLNQDEIMVEVCESAKSTIRLARRNVVKGNADGGHHLQTQLKVAAALAILDGRSSVLDDDWFIAGYLMSRSARVLANLKVFKSEQFAASNKSRAEAEADREMVKARLMDDDANKRVSQAILRKLSGEWMTAGELKRSIAARDRTHMENALEHLESINSIEVQEIPNRNGQIGKSYRIGG